MNNNAVGSVCTRRRALVSSLLQHPYTGLTTMDLMDITVEVEVEI
jgi:hypothetical protein